MLTPLPTRDDRGSVTDLRRRYAWRRDNLANLEGFLRSAKSMSNYELQETLLDIVTILKES